MKYEISLLLFFSKTNNNKERGKETEVRLTFIFSNVKHGDSSTRRLNKGRRKYQEYSIGKSQKWGLCSQHYPSWCPWEKKEENKYGLSNMMVKNRDSRIKRENKIFKG